MCADVDMWKRRVEVHVLNSLVKFRSKVFNMAGLTPVLHSQCVY